jgi:hypothetical protein
MVLWTALLGHGQGRHRKRKHRCDDKQAKHDDSSECFCQLPTSQSILALVDYQNFAAM